MVSDATLNTGSEGSERWEVVLCSGATRGLPERVQSPQRGFKAQSVYKPPSRAQERKYIHTHGEKESISVYIAALHVSNVTI